MGSATGASLPMTPGVRRPCPVTRPADVTVATASMRTTNTADSNSERTTTSSTADTAASWTVARTTATTTGRS